MTNFFARHPSHGSAIPARRAVQQQQQMVEAPHLHPAAKERAAAPTAAPTAARPVAAAQRHAADEVPPIISPVFSPNIHSLERLRGGHFHPIAKHTPPAVRLYRAGKLTPLQAAAAPAAAAAKPAVPASAKRAAGAAAAARPPLPSVATAPRRHRKLPQQRGAEAPLSVRIRRRLDRLIDGNAAHLRERLSELLGDSFVATIPARVAAIPRAINTSEAVRVLGLAALAARRYLNSLAGGDKKPQAAAAARRFIGSERGPLLPARGRDSAPARAQQKPRSELGARAGARRAAGAFSLPLSLQLRRLAVQIGRRLRRRGLNLSDLAVNLPQLNLSQLGLPQLSLPNLAASLPRLDLPHLVANLPRLARGARGAGTVAAILRKLPAGVAAALLVPAMRAAYNAGVKADAGRVARGFARTRLDAPLASRGSSLGDLYRIAARAAMAQLPVSNEMWYRMLERPAWALSHRLADMAWTAAFACMALACFRLLTAPAALGTRVRALFAFGLQLAFCATCGLATLALRSPVAGLVHHVLFAGALVRAMTTARRVDGLAAAALAPVVGLILFECLVQGFVVAKN